MATPAILPRSTTIPDIGFGSGYVLQVPPSGSPHAGHTGHAVHASHHGHSPHDHGHHSHGGLGHQLGYREGKDIKGGRDSSRSSGDLLKEAAEVAEDGEDEVKVNVPEYASPGNTLTNLKNYDEHRKQRRNEL